MTWVDVALLVGTLVVAVMGWRAGVITTVAGFAGFLGGAILGAWLVPQVLSGTDWPALLAGVATIAAMVLLGLVGQAILGTLGRAVRDVVGIGPIRLLDQASGMVVSAVAFLMAAWMLLSVAATLPGGGAGQAVRTSRSYPLLDQVMAGPGGRLLDDARSLLARFDLPSLPFNPATLPPVAEPDDVDLGDEVVDVARSSVLQVTATSDRCGLSQVGSGVVMADQRVVTNAHVVAGSGTVTVRTAGSRRAATARLVLLDRATDVAVLYVPGLDAPVLDWGDVSRGTEGAVAGYPGGGRLTVGAARVRGAASVGDDAGRGSREVVVFRGTVRPGNSGGALLDLSGDVMGVVFANSSLDDSTGFALPRAEVEPALDQAATATREVSSGSCPAD